MNTHWMNTSNINEANSQITKRLFSLKRQELSNFTLKEISWILTPNKSMVIKSLFSCFGFYNSLEELENKFNEEFFDFVHIYKNFIMNIDYLYFTFDFVDKKIIDKIVEINHLKFRYYY